MDAAAENLAPELTPVPRAPTLWRKSVALVVDLLVLAGLGAGLCYPLTGGMPALAGFGWLPFFTLVCAYFLVQECVLVGGATLGKKLVSLRVVGTEGAPLSRARGFGKIALLALSIILVQMPGFLGIASIHLGAILVLFWVTSTLSMLLHPQKRGLHDLLFGARVIGGNPQSLEPAIGVTRTLRGLSAPVLFVLSTVTTTGAFLINDQAMPLVLRQLQEQVRSATSDSSLHLGQMVHTNENGTHVILTVTSMKQYIAVDPSSFKDLSEKVFSGFQSWNPAERPESILLRFRYVNYWGIIPLTSEASFVKPFSALRQSSKY